MTPIVFLDTETTSLNPWRRVWDIALIRRDENGEQGYQWFISADDLDLGHADPFALNVGRFYDRHPHYCATSLKRAPLPERDVLRSVEELTRGAHLVGAVPNFDADVLDQRMRANGILPSWHYHLIDVEALAVGYLSACGYTIDLPWKSDDLSRACGIEPPSDEDRHTAIGDAKWAQRLYDAITSGK